MRMQNIGGTNKEYYGIFDIGFSINCVFEKNLFGQYCFEGKAQW